MLFFSKNVSSMRQKVVSVQFIILSPGYRLLLLLSHFSRVRLCACNPIDGNPPGSPIPGILQPRTLEWVAISF